MASGGVGSEIVYKGMVEFVTKSYGFVRLQNNNPVPKAFFDRSSLLNRKIDDLSEEFPKGCQVKSCIVPTDGEHKVKFKAVKLRSSGKPKQKSGPKPKDSGQSCDKSYAKTIPDLMENFALYAPRQRETAMHIDDRDLVKYLQNGAIQLEKLAENFKILKNSDAPFMDQIMKVVQSRPDYFAIKNGFVCLMQKEDRVTAEIIEEMKTYHNKIPFDAVTAIIPPEHQDRRYLHSPEQWNVGVKDFVSRNCSKFVFWDNHIWNKRFLLQKQNSALMEMFQKDLIAVLYYSQFVLSKGSLAIKSLMGHCAQASKEVKDVCKATDDDFRQFLERNAFFFTLQGNMVKECPTHRITCIANSWLTKKSRSSASGPSFPNPKPRRSSGPQSPRAEPIAAPFKDTIKTPVQVSKAFSDMEAENSSKKASPAKKKNANKSYTSKVKSEVTSSGPEPLLQSPESYMTATVSGGVYSSMDAKVFKNLIGEQISHAIEDEMLPSHTLNSLLLLRLNVGKPPMASFRIPGERKGLKHDFDQLPPSKTEDIQRILRRNEVSKPVFSTHYGVKGTLHSILTRESGSKVEGLTLFCQLHEDSDGMDLDMWERNNFTAVFTGNYPDKHIYNFLRTKCHTLSKSEDVLVIDVNGQLSGCNESLHPSLGNVTRINCKSSSELAETINESIQHMHGYVITINVDSQEHLSAIQKMRNQDTHVFAAVSSAMKTEAEKLFSS